MLEQNPQTLLYIIKLKTMMDNHQIDLLLDIDINIKSRCVDIFIA